ncbi:hypothetical protein THAOC_02300 [Thalassiosira oceanica]|uniref:Plastid lipid-associated protein/fibrillin conserved domain-containing protein n=1 Tax=Thalassiosira oceanica TaxID=159749 RepID=K0TFX7_THAOC|nr:hypothetical protein THAOC_02300 [Thalassiosira oceanica]|eukprot:EJK75959.1 hypothetical protein THAOC_02300 [Thalassiosira oceanica]
MNLSLKKIVGENPRAVFGETTGSILLGRVPSTRRRVHWVGPWPPSTASTSNNHRCIVGRRFVGSDVLATQSRAVFLSRVSLLQAADVAGNRLSPNRADDGNRERYCLVPSSARFGDMSSDETAATEFNDSVGNTTSSHHSVTTFEVTDEMWVLSGLDVVGYNVGVSPNEQLRNRELTVCNSQATAGIEESKQLLLRAATTKEENPSDVLEALESIERDCRSRFKEDPAKFSEDILNNISGDWRLIFTTGTKEQQERRGGRINYFSPKAVQSFRADTTPKQIENGIYVGDFPLVKFSGDWEWNERVRKLEFDFDKIQLLGLISINLGRKEVAQIGSASGLGSKNNEKLAAEGKKAFFTWISADDNIATARGGGGGLALWKRVENDPE